jgi:hypothetical protein
MTESHVVRHGESRCDLNAGPFVMAKWSPRFRIRHGGQLHPFVGYVRGLFPSSNCGDIVQEGGRLKQGWPMSPQHGRARAHGLVDDRQLVAQRGSLRCTLQSEKGGDQTFGVRASCAC